MRPQVFNWMEIYLVEELAEFKFRKCNVNLATKLFTVPAGRQLNAYFYVAISIKEMKYYYFVVVVAGMLLIINSC